MTEQERAQGEKIIREKTDRQRIKKRKVEVSKKQTGVEIKQTQEEIR